VHVHLAAPLDTCTSSDSPFRTINLVASATVALPQLRRVYFCLRSPIQIQFAAVRFLVNFSQTGFDRKQNDGTNESLLYKPIATFRALSTTRHAPDDVLRTWRDEAYRSDKILSYNGLSLPFALVLPLLIRRSRIAYGQRSASRRPVRLQVELARFDQCDSLLNSRAIAFSAFVIQQS
jgi:hypothetical protein